MYKELVKKCRVCSGTPFGSLFGILMGEDDNIYDKNGDLNSPDLLYDDDSTDDEEGTRSPNDLKQTINSWKSYVHSRANKCYPNDNDILIILEEIGRGCGRGDPILKEDCVIWKGELSKENDSPIITYKTTGSSKPTTSLVTRILAFFFADEESFSKLKDKPKEPFKMACGNKLCVCVLHVSVDD